LGRHLLTVAAFAVLTLGVSAVLVWAFEGRADPSHPHAFFWGFYWVTLTLLTGSAATTVTTTAGTVLLYVVLFAGIGLVASATGAFASWLVEMLMRKGRGLGRTRVSGHILICGWNEKGHEILRELHAEEVEDKRPVVILAPLERNPSRDTLTTFVHGTPSASHDLMRAGLDRADTAIILADDSKPNQSADDIDARTLLTALAIESLAPNCYTCVEVIRSENVQHFEHAHADETVISAELGGSLLAAAATTHGLSEVIHNLITHPEGNEFYGWPVPADFEGLTFVGAMQRLKQPPFDGIAVAVATGDGNYDINPPPDRVLRAGDRLLVISAHDPADAASNA